MKNWINTLLVLQGLTFLFPLFFYSQTLPSNRSVDWTLAGLQLDTIHTLPIVDMQNFGVTSDAFTPNDEILTNVINKFLASGAVLVFPAGQFLFHSSINLPSNFVIKGQGADSTIFLMDLKGSGHAIAVKGSFTNDTSKFVKHAYKDSTYIPIWNAGAFAANDWIHIKQYDSDLITSSWAEKSVGQIVQIDRIEGNILWLKSPLRLDYDTVRKPYIQKINPKQNIGIECLKIIRLDDTAPQQSSNIHFSHAVNCWVKGVESENCTFSHLTGEYCSNLYVTQSYFHHGFDYGGNGRAYGVVLQFSTGESLIENNVLEHLRHSMLLQAGANGNVFAYNYSLDPYWSSIPSNSAGDIVLHGNYVYANLFEQNIVQNIVIDNSHGPNGPYNTFLRNRSESYGIFFSAANSPYQNFLGNEITNTNFPFNLVNYTIQGENHFIHGNNNKGSIIPAGTESLPDLTYAYSSPPAFVPSNQFAKIGTPNSLNSADIPAKDRYNNHQIIGDICSDVISTKVKTTKTMNISFYPNPSEIILTIESKHQIKNIIAYNELGEIVYVRILLNEKAEICISEWNSGVYFLKIQFEDGTQTIQKIIKM